MVYLVEIQLEQDIGLLLGTLIVMVIIIHNHVLLGLNMKASIAQTKFERLITGMPNGNVSSSIYGTCCENL